MYCMRHRLIPFTWRTLALDKSTDSNTVSVFAIKTPLCVPLHFKRWMRGSLVVLFSILIAGSAQHMNSDHQIVWVLHIDSGRVVEVTARELCLFSGEISMRLCVLTISTGATTATVALTHMRRESAETREAKIIVVKRRMTKEVEVVVVDLCVEDYCAVKKF